MPQCIVTSYYLTNFKFVNDSLILHAITVFRNIYNPLLSNEHITYIKNNISKANGIMYKTRQYFNKSLLVNLCYSYGMVIVYLALPKKYIVIAKYLMKYMVYLSGDI